MTNTDEETQIDDHPHVKDVDTSLPEGYMLFEDAVAAVNRGDYPHILEAFQNGLRS